MNARHTHALIRARFPVFVASAHAWELLAHGDSNDTARVHAFLHAHFTHDTLVVHVSRKLGGLMTIDTATKLITSVIGQAEIRLASPDFTELAVIGHPGVATAWRQAV
ncbi:hypothetical protein NYO99_13440 [Pelomonas sp. UHG3]|uniref:Uncharacterized protein n=1 Tax=Roseateles hydrophilus TaxID=2975054 RepID=A0ACC6CC48_9BURK|nr:hypothetical protein [Pelomonas sp. UHG3]MCY4745983.1 hypothetical protein [Pelomonas sp. UHG3]